MPPAAQPPALSLALAGLQPAGTAPADLREIIPRARATGFAAIHLNTAARGIRPRDLDRSARRDLAAIIRREGLDLSGSDLWIPPEHFTDPGHSDRAVTATLGSIELVAELASLVRGIGSTAPRPVLSVALPSGVAGAILSGLAAAAERAGVRIADHAVPLRAADPSIEPAVGIGLDSASLLAAGLDPVSQVSANARRLASARLSDVSRSIGGGRVIPGSREGKLDLLAYSVSLMTAEYSGWVVADTRSLADPDSAAALMLANWRNSLSMETGRHSGR